MHGQALEGKDVKDLLLNVGSGGGAAAAAPGGGAAAGGAGGAAEETKEEEKKEEGMLGQLCAMSITDQFVQRRRSRTRTWASVSSIKSTSRQFPCSFCLVGGS
jgi:hypothetical protein